MSELAPFLRQRYFDANGQPLAGGKLYSYLAGTSTPASTYTDATGSTPNANPTILDANGEANVWLGSATYKFVLNDSSDVEQWSVDNVASNAIVPPVVWVTHAVTDGQSASSLSGETVDSAVYLAADYNFHIIRGTTVFASGTFTLQYLNSAWRIELGEYRSDISHGVTFSEVTTSGVAQLQAALDVGAGNGTIYLSRQLLAK